MKHAHRLLLQINGAPLMIVLSARWLLDARSLSLTPFKAL